MPRPERRDRAVTTPGSLLATGRTSDVYALGSDSVVKVPRLGVPGHWAAVEARIARSVHSLGLPTPEVHDVVVVDGRDAIVFERIYGPSMWDMLCDDPRRLPELTDLMIDVQRKINAIDNPDGVPDLLKRTRTKIEEAELLTALERDQVVGMADDLPAGSSLCHGDLHPGNILMGPGGPVVIDWFDAGVGHRGADTVRTSLLIRPSAAAGQPSHLPGASVALLNGLHQRYLSGVAMTAGATGVELLRWERVLAAGRLAEQLDDNDEELLALSRPQAESDSCRTKLEEELLSLGLV